MTRLHAVLALALLSACAGPLPQVCQLNRQADLPVHLNHGHVVIPGTIDRAPVQFVVDTGAGTLLDGQVAHDLHLPPDPAHKTILYGLGGRIVTTNAVAPTLRLGSLAWSDLSLTTGPLGASVDAEAPPIAGMIGGDLLSRFDVELDIPHGFLALWRGHGCSGDFVHWQGPHFVAVMAQRPGHRLLTQVRIDGHAIAALIDWGARHSAITTAAAEALGVTPAALARDPGGLSHGIDNGRLPFHLHTFAELRIGTELLHDVRLEVSNLRLDDAGLLLGADYLHDRRVWLSYTTGQMFVAPARRASSATPAAAGAALAYR